MVGIDHHGRYHWAREMMEADTIGNGSANAGASNPTLVVDMGDDYVLVGLNIRPGAPTQFGGLAADLSPAVGTKFKMRLDLLKLHRGANPERVDRFDLETTLSNPSSSGGSTARQPVIDQGVPIGEGRCAILFSNDNMAWVCLVQRVNDTMQVGDPKLIDSRPPLPTQFNVPIGYINPAHQPVSGTGEHEGDGASGEGINIFKGSPVFIQPLGTNQVRVGSLWYAEESGGVNTNGVVGNFYGLATKTLSYTDLNLAFANGESAYEGWALTTFFEAASSVYTWCHGSVRSDASEMIILMEYGDTIQLVQFNLTTGVRVNSLQLYEQTQDNPDNLRAQVGYFQLQLGRTGQVQVRVDSRQQRFQTQPGHFPGSTYYLEWEGHYYTVTSDTLTKIHEQIAPLSWTSTRFYNAYETHADYYLGSNPVGKLGGGYLISMGESREISADTAVFKGVTYGVESEIFLGLWDVDAYAVEIRKPFLYDLADSTQPGPEPTYYDAREMDTDDQNAVAVIGGRWFITWHAYHDAETSFQVWSLATPASVAERPARVAFYAKGLSS